MASRDRLGGGEAGLDLSRRAFLKSVGVLAAGVVWTVSEGTLRGRGLRALEAAEQAPAGFSFVQISDSHIGFRRPPNADPTATLRETVARINAMPAAPDFIVHTGDASDLTKPDEHDMFDQTLSGLKVKQIHYLPGEHDVIGDDGKLFLSRYAKQAARGGWYSFDHKGVHFITLVNVVNRSSTGAGHLGDDQIAWATKDLQGQPPGTPIVVFSHIPLWTVYTPWGWNTDDIDPVTAQLRRFSSVTVLNGHIHQIQQGSDGNISYRTAGATAYPQPRPGKAPAPGPLVVPADQLRSYLGWRLADSAPGKPIAVTDTALAAGADPAKQAMVDIKDFRFVPQDLTVAVGTAVTWTNHDNEAHTIMSDDKTFTTAPQLVESGGQFSHTFDKAGVFPYHCTIHPFMHGRITVK
jgi:Icc protein